LIDGILFYLLFVVEHVLELFDRDEDDDEQMNRVVQSVVDVHPYAVQQMLNIAQHYATHTTANIDMKNLLNLQNKNLQQHH